MKTDNAVNIIINTMKPHIIYITENCQVTFSYIFVRCRLLE